MAKAKKLETYPRKYTITNVFRRLARTDDPRADIARHGQSVSAARERLSAMA